MCQRKGPPHAAVAPLPDPRSAFSLFFPPVWLLAAALGTTAAPRGPGPVPGRVMAEGLCSAAERPRAARCQVPCAGTTGGSGGSEAGAGL